MTPPTKVVLSPCLYELMTTNETEDVEMAHFSHLQSLFSFLMPLNVEFDLYEDAPYYPDSMKRPPISRYHYHKTACSQIYAKILKKVCYEPVVSLEEYPPSSLISEYDYPETSETKNSFLRYITYLSINNKKNIMFIGIANESKPRPYIFQLPDSTQIKITPISNPSIDCSHQLGELIITKECNNIFPNANMCIALNEYFLKMRNNKEDRISLIKEIGTEVAFRNGFCYNQYLSVLNSKKQQSSRDIYCSIGKSTTYLSLDFESGGFEVFDHSGTHLGQFSFDGKQVKLASPNTHKLFFS